MNLYYALDESNYTWGNALLWGNCIAHFKKAEHGSLGDRVVHVVIGITELFPVIGQIASIIEKIVVDIFRPSPSPKPTEEDHTQFTPNDNSAIQKTPKTDPQPQVDSKDFIAKQKEQDEALRQWNNQFKQVITTNKDNHYQISTQHKKLRIPLYQSTKAACKDGFYVDNEFIQLSDTDRKSMHKGTVLSSPEKLEPIKDTTAAYKTVYEVVDEDTIDLMLKYIAEELNPSGLNLANPNNPGGGVEHGSGAQEESIFRRTNYHEALYPHAKGGKKPFYNLDHKNVVYTPNVQNFRTKELDYSKPLDETDLGYTFHKPQPLSFVAAAHVKFNAPNDETKNKLIRLDKDLAKNSQDPKIRKELEEECDKVIKTLVSDEPSYETFTKFKMRAILRTAFLKGHDSLVLGALGCGAFHNPKALNAIYWEEVLSEAEFQGRFKKIGFAILKFGAFNELFDIFNNIIPKLNKKIIKV